MFIKTGSPVPVTVTKGVEESVVYNTTLLPEDEEMRFLLRDESAPLPFMDYDGKTLSEIDVANIYCLSFFGGKNQREIAEIFSVDPATIGRILSNKRRPLSMSTYQVLAHKTSNISLDRQIRLTAAVLGLTGEAGEVADVFKKHIAHGHPLDKDSLIREVSDILWYIAEIATLFEISLDTVGWGNIQKLKARYPEGFSSYRSINRVE